MIFKSTKLANGITIHAKPTDVPFAVVWIYVPVGSAHNIGKVLPGTAHFLEHIVYGRSHLYPERNQFQKKIELNGGDFNAMTYPMYTLFCLSIRSDMFNEAFKGLMSHVFDPLIKAEDIISEAGIILSESNRDNKWYPGGDEFEHYYMTDYKKTGLLNARQKIGNESDLKKMSVDMLSNLHNAYLDPRTFVIVGGSFDQKVVIKELSKLKTKKHKFPMKFEQIEWANKKYHEKKFGDVSQFLYYFGGIVPEHDPMTGVGIGFIGELLTNYTHGVLYEWLRNELGWCYNMSFDFDYDHNPHIYNNWELCLPMGTHKQVQHVRKEIHNKILQAISNKELVAREVERQKSCSLFAYQTLRSTMSDADSMLRPYGGRIFTEADDLKLLERCKDTSFLKEIYNKYWSPKVIGEFLAMPK